MEQQLTDHPLQPKPRHPLLHAFYPHVTSLTDLLPPDTVRDSDSDAFKALVNGIVVGSLEKLVLTAEIDGSIQTPIDEVIERAQAKLFQQFKKEKAERERLSTSGWIPPSPPHVLTLGYRSNDGSTSGETIAWSYRPATFESYNPNTTVESICRSSEWQDLVNRVGPSPLLTIFSSYNIAVFTSLPNDCFLQIAGTPIADVIPRATTIREAQKLVKEAEAEISEKATWKRGSRVRKRGKKSKNSDQALAPIVPAVTVVPPQDGPMARRLVATRSAPQLSTSDTRLLQPVSSILATPLRPTQSASLLPIGKRAADSVKGGVRKKVKLEPKKPGEVLLVRSRLFYARPSRTASGKVAYGLPSKHILNRLSDLFQNSQTISDPRSIERKARHLIKYLFPRQYGLQNVFTSPKPMWGETIDYGNREDEIQNLGSIKTPKRLKDLLPLMKRMMRLHHLCNFRTLLDRHCPSKIKHTTLTPEEKSFLVELMTEPVTQMSRADVSLEVSDRSILVPLGGPEAEAKVRAKPQLSDYLCTAYQAQAYTSAVIRQVVPKDFWGSKNNEKLIIDYVGELLTLRRFETFSLHTILQKFRISDCNWLRPRSASLDRTKNDKPNAVEMAKRLELLAEFLHWFINGFVIDIAKTAFCITQSAVSKHRSLFFRQDDWHSLSQPLMENLRDTMFEPSNDTDGQANKLGFSYVRLMPKETGVRPITNLKRRPKVVKRNGNVTLGRSINKILGNSFLALTLEKNRNPELTGAAVHAPSEVYERLKSFKVRLQQEGKKLPRLYFVKLDVRACYDTIQQTKLLEIIEDVLRERHYRMLSYSQAMPESGRVAKKWPTKAFAGAEAQDFPTTATELTDMLRHAILTDKVFTSVENRDRLMNLVTEHVTNNLVKISGNMYRQKNGIPQGSILSGLLCALFYGHMEREKLAFLEGTDSLLLRHTDDFLLISTEKPLAIEFLRAMSAGFPEYGCFISPEKRLTNFPISLDGIETIPPCGSKDFPWCGRTINTETLEVKVDTSRLEDSIADGLTVQFSGKPGEAFESKMMQAVKIRAEILYNDTTLNSVETVYLNIYQRFLLVALKFQTYVHEWGTDPRRNPKFFFRVIERVVSFGYRTMMNRSTTKVAKRLGGECVVRQSWILWLGYHAFQRVLIRRSALYLVVLKSLKERLRTRQNVQRRLQGIINNPTNSFVNRPSWKR